MANVQQKLVGHGNLNKGHLKEMSSRLDRVTDWMQQAKEARYRIAVLAVGLEVTPRHLQRYFIDRFGIAPKDVMRRLQMEAARDLLAARHSVKEVSLELGFHHPTHFSRAFKQANGTAPGDYFGSQLIGEEPDVRFWSEMSDLGLPSELCRDRRSRHSFSSTKEQFPNPAL